MVIQALVWFTLVSAPTPLPKLVATSSVTAGKVRVERANRDAVFAGRYERLRIGDTITIVERPAATVRFDLSRETFRLPEQGSWQLLDRGFKQLDGTPPKLVHREQALSQAPGTKPPSLAGRIRGDSVTVSPVGAIAQLPLTAEWSRATGARQAKVDLVDSAGKVLATKSGITLTQWTVPSKNLESGKWLQLRVTQSVAGSPSVSSTWIRLLTPAERKSCEAAERSLREALSGDPVALGEALGELWASVGLVSRFPDALALIFGKDSASPESSWKHGQWLETAGFPRSRPRRIRARMAGRWTSGRIERQH